MDSDHRPRAYQARALTGWAMGLYFARVRSLSEIFSFRKMWNILLCKMWNILRMRNILLRKMWFSLHARRHFTRDAYFTNPAGIYLTENASAFSLVEVRGFEPLTPCLQGRCSPSWATPPKLGTTHHTMCFAQTRTKKIEQQPNGLIVLSWYCFLFKNFGNLFRRSPHSP